MGGESVEWMERGAKNLELCSAWTVQQKLPVEWAVDHSVGEMRLLLNNSKMVGFGRRHMRKTHRTSVGFVTGFAAGRQRGPSFIHEFLASRYEQDGSNSRTSLAFPCRSISCGKSFLVKEYRHGKRR